MKKILNATKEGVCQAITAHYHKEGVGNIIGGGSSIILATAVIEYEDGIQNVPIPQGVNKGGILNIEYCPTISRSSWQNNCLLIEFIDDEMHTKTREK